LHLPKSCPIQSLVVEGKSNKLKQIACLQASKKLHEIGELSDFLLPAFDGEMEVDDQESGNFPSCLQCSVLSRICFIPLVLAFNDSSSSFYKIVLNCSWKLLCISFFVCACVLMPLDDCDEVLTFHFTAQVPCHITLNMSTIFLENW